MAFTRKARDGENTSLIMIRMIIRLGAFRVTLDDEGMFWEIG